VVAQRLCKECRCQNPLRIQKEKEAQEGQSSSTSSVTPSRGVGRQKGIAKVGAFERFQFSQVWDKSTQGAQEE
jgi:hypothetical protein